MHQVLLKVTPCLSLKILSGDFCITNDYAVRIVNILDSYHELGFKIYLKTFNIFQIPDFLIIVKHSISFFCLGGGGG